MPHYIVKCSSIPHYIVKYSSMPHLSQYYTLHVIVRGMRIWPPNAAKCCKNAGKFFPDGVSAWPAVGLATQLVTRLVAGIVGVIGYTRVL
jgi:hypothetical protein